MNKVNSIKMKNMPIGKLIFSMSLPAMFSMFIQALYNIVDSIYVSKISEDNLELSAIGLAFPMQMVLIGFAIGIGVGANALIARKLGEKNFEGASNTARCAIIWSLVFSILFLILGLTIVDWYLRLMSNNEFVISYAKDYLSIVMIFCLGMYVEITISKIIQATGNMIFPMISQLIGAVTNIILDPIFIFGFLGIPAMGIKGAAIATVIGQYVSMFFVLVILIFKKMELSFKIKGFKPKFNDFTAILKIGIPSTFMNIIGSITLTSLNKILNSIDKTETSVAVLGVYFKLQSFVFMPVFGLNQGGMPILAYNYGSNDKKRFLRSLKLLLITSFSIMVFGTVIFQVFPSQLLALFNPSAYMIEIGISSLRLISLAFIPASIGIILTMVFQAVGHPLKSLFMSMIRQLLVLLPFAFIVSKYIGVKGVWLAYPAGEIICALVSIPLSIYVIKKVFLEKEINKIIRSDIANDDFI